MTPTPSSPTIPDAHLKRLLSRERLSSYVDACGGFEPAIELYRWNASVSAAFWPSLGHLEVTLRNAMSESLAVRHGETVEDPVARLHDLRNRIAHHQRVWNRDLAARYADLLLVAGYLDPGLPAWIARGCTVPALLRAQPRRAATPGC